MSQSAQADLCDQAGVRYIGTQHGLVFFDLADGTAASLPLAELTAEAIKAKIAAMNQAKAPDVQL